MSVFLLSGLLADNSGFRKTIVPVLMYSGDAGFGTGAYVMMRKNFRQTDKTDKYSIAGIFTSEKQIMTFVSVDKYLIDGFKFKTKFSFRDKPATVYLPGHDTKFEDHADYDLQEFNLTLYPVWEFSCWEFGPLIGYSDFKISHREEDREYIFNNIDGSEDYSLLAYGLRISADTRDNDNYPEKGCYFESEFSNNDKGFLGDYSFQQLESEVRYFQKLSYFTIATQFYTKFSWGNTPIHKMPSMGSNDIMRGISSKRFKDMEMMVVQAELRFPLFNRFYGTVFSGAGNVATKISRLRMSSLKVAYGAGLRYAVSPEERVHLRLDIGTNNKISDHKDDDLYNIYFSIGEAF